NLRKRVAATALVNTATPAADGTSDGSQNRLAASYYSYDAAGNVGDLYQENTTQSTTEKQYIIGTDGLKHLQYEYDLVSGKVNKVLYQPGKWDQFYYRYKYDDDNRLTDVYSSRINYTSSSELTNWVPEAHYTYYLHGPLARVELGKHKVQGLDYAYTLQGWLKGVNTQKLDGTSDIAGDGISGSDFSTVARDAIGFSLGYYNGDYTPIGGGSANALGLKYTGTDQKQSGASLFNGNITHATYAIQGIDGGNTAAYSYRYDQLNRLIGMNRHQIGTGRTTLNNSSIIEAYKEKITYDGNGNILTYLRNGANSGSLPLEMDDLNYGYNKDASGRLLNNRLRHVKDRIADNKYTEDIDNQPDDNYLYDGIGNMIKDGAGSIDQIKWTVYGKIESIQKKDGTKISYVYDVSGNRISKTVSTSSSSNTTYYVRDAQGNVLGVYNQSGAAYNWQEQDLYGSSRLGMLRPNLSIASSSPLGSDQYNSSVDPVDNGIEGVRTYELTNHLSNVLATITDRKIGVDLDGNGTIDYYKTDVTSAQDYYPFGMQMPGRVFNNGSYRYGFNGKENDNEVKGVGNQQDYGMRVYDPRLGKFLSVDPLTRSYPQLTPYQYASNTPIAYIDLDGLEKYHYTLTLDDQGNSHIKLVSVENFSEWQWKPKLGGTFLGFQLWEEVKNPRKEFIVEYNFKDIVVVGAAAGQVDTKLSLTFNSEADALKANINDFESQFRNLDIAKGL
ncbi:MAG TPA: RHS repeat-associated core domain-containing protein, partial [Flavisolibacter sp.]|nr:RHS repeat-associated core domain-containing protein [Flavisolibacter sp.]